MEVRIFSTAEPAYRSSLELRNRCLRIPLGRDVFKEDLSDEKNQMHFGLFEEGRLLACVILKPLGDGSVKLRQMVVEEAVQCQGLGKELIQGMERLAKERGVESIEMSARISAQGFYEKMGYRCEGGIFQEVGLDHVKMTKGL